jgi:glycerol-3-phosphate acyltransferase PlsY
MSMTSVEGILLVVGGYLVGSIPTGVILARLFSATDIRREGSGNIGATNVYRVLGAKLGVITLVGDVLKGVVPVILTRFFMGDDVWIASVALSTFLGHLYPLFLRFRGGKGVATALGIFMVITPLVTAGAVIVFIVVVMRWKYVSLGSLAASASMPLFLGAGGYSLVYGGLSMMIGGFIFYRHGDNIKRLREGLEKKISKDSKKGSFV